MSERGKDSERDRDRLEESTWERRDKAHEAGPPPPSPNRGETQRQPDQNSDDTGGDSK